MPQNRCSGCSSWGCRGTRLYVNMKREEHPQFFLPPQVTGLGAGSWEEACPGLPAGTWEAVVENMRGA